MAMVGMPGALGCVKPANLEVQSICNQMRKPVELEAGRSFITFRALQYKPQVVAGINYFIKVYVGYNEYIHIQIYKPLPHTNEPMSLTGIQLGKTKHDDITFF